MRLLFFSITFRPFIGGAEVAVEEILKRLSDVRATVITARLKKELPCEEMQGNITIKRIGWGRRADKYLYPWIAFRTAVKLHKENPFVINQAIMANYAGLAALFFKWKFPNIPYLLTLQSGDSPFFIWIRTWWFYPIYKRVYKKADFIQAISNYLIDRAKRYGYRGKYQVVPNGVDYELFSKFIPEEEKKRLRNELHIKDDEKVIITTSRLVYKNAIDQLILGFHEWRSKTRKQAKLLIIGDGRKRKRLVKLAEKIGASPNVIFVSHKLYEKLPYYLQISDIFIRPSRSEGMGNSFIEAMAAGVPVIGTEVGGIPDFLIHGKTGLFCDKDNPDSIARAINELVNNNELKNRLIANGRELARVHYDWANISQKMNMIYKKLIS